jgi:hypothetical protein
MKPSTPQNGRSKSDASGARSVTATGSSFRKSGRNIMVGAAVVTAAMLSLPVISPASAVLAAGWTGTEGADATQTAKVGETTVSITTDTPSVRVTSEFGPLTKASWVSESSVLTSRSRASRVATTRLAIEAMSSSSSASR